ncbi:FxsA Protein affecting phage T7 exclusion by the F plasmid [Candidatus Methylopumilus universalis]|uniref:FxsA family protein n=1 Tax=Candidatus Methylopumilus TaxID=1679002 RepID=UPI003BEEE7CB
MRLLFTILLLSFPVIEIWGIFKLSALYGWWFFLYMVLVSYLGWRLIKEEKQLVVAKFMGAMSQGGNPIKVMIGSARNLFVGLLFIIPGVITDLFAVILLLIPIKNNASQNINPSEEDVIEGEYRRDDELLK